MLRKTRSKKIPLTFLFEFALDMGVWRKMEYEDRKYLDQLSRYTVDYFIRKVYVFHLSDIKKVRKTLQKYNIRLTYPSRTELREHGLSYSGLSLEIEGQGDSFKITQYWADGTINTYIVPKDRVFRVYYLLKEFGRPVKPAELWEKICRAYNLNRYFDRSGKFYKNSFEGDRRVYYNFYYLPVKVLEHIGKIKYGKKLEVIE